MTIGVVIKMSDDVNKHSRITTNNNNNNSSRGTIRPRFDSEVHHDDDDDAIRQEGTAVRRKQETLNNMEQQQQQQRKRRLVSMERRLLQQRRTAVVGTMVFFGMLVVLLNVGIVDAKKFSFVSPNQNQHKDVIRMLNSDAALPGRSQRKLLPTLDKLAGYYEYYENQKAESDGDSTPSKGEDDTEQEYYYNTTLVVVEEVNGTVVENPEEHYYYSHSGGPEGTPEPEGTESSSSSETNEGEEFTQREWEECVSEQMTAEECKQHILDSLGGNLNNHEIPDLQIKFHHQRTPEQLSSSYWMYGVSTNIFGRVDCHTNHGQSIYAFQWETSEGTYDLPPVVCPKGGDAVACCQQFIAEVTDLGIPTTDINGNCLSCWVHQEPLVPMKDPAASSTADTNGETEVDDDDVVYLAHDYDEDGMCVEKILTKQQVQGLDAEVHMDLESKLINTLNMLLSAPSDEESPGASCLEVREATVAMERYGGNYPHSMTKMTGLFCGQCIEGSGEEFIHLSNHQRSMLEFILEDIATPAKSDDHCIVIYTDHTGQNILSIPNVGGKRNTNLHQFTNEPPAVPTAPSPTTPTMPTVSVPTIIRPTIQIGTPPTDDTGGMPDEHGCLSHEKYNSDTQDCVERCDKELEQVWDSTSKECVPMCSKIGEIWSTRDMECVPRCNMSDGEIYNVEVDDCVPLCNEEIGEVFDANVPGCVFLCSSHEGQIWFAEHKTCVSICDATQGLAFAPDAPTADQNGCILTCDGMLGLMFDPLSPKADVNGCVQICDPMMGYIFNPSEGSMADEDGCVALCNKDEGYTFKPDDPMANEHGCIMIDIVVDCPEGYEYHPEMMSMMNMTNSTDMCIPMCDDHQTFDVSIEECVPRCSRSDGLEYDPEDSEADPETGCAPICRMSENKRQATQQEIDEGLAGTMGCMTLCDEGLVYYPDASTANDYGCVPYCTTKEDGMLYDMIYDPANANADPDTGCVSICDPSMGLTYMPDDPQANSQGCISVCQDDPSTIWSIEEQECISICGEGYEYNPDSDEADSNGCVRSGIEPGGGLGEGDEECDMEQGEIYDPENPNADPATGCLLLCDPSEGLIYDHHPDMPEDSGCISVCVDDSSTRWSKSQDKCVPICEAEDGEVYMPDHPDADKDETSSDYGCVSVCLVEYPNGSHVWSTDEQTCVAKCAKDGLKYMPEDETADEDGCVPICLESDGLKWPSSDEEATERESELTPQGCLPICDDPSQMYDMETGNCIDKCDMDNEGLLYDPTHPDSDPLTGCVSKCIVNNPTKQLAWNTSSKTCKYICGKPLVSGEKYHVESDTCVPICDESTGVTFDPEASNADPETGCVPICNEEDGLVFDSNKKECVSVCDDDPSKIYSEEQDKCVPLCDESEGKTFNGSGCSTTCLASDGLKFSKPSYEDDPEKPCVPLCDESKGEVFDESTEGCKPKCDGTKGLTFDSNSKECVDLCMASDGLKFSIESYEDDPEKPCVALCDETLGETFDGTDSCEPLCDMSKGLVFDLDEGTCMDICMATEGLQFSSEAYDEDPSKPCVSLCDESIGETFDGTDGCKPLCDEMKGETFDSSNGECIDICLASNGLQFSLEAYEDPDVEDPCVPLCDSSKGLTFDEASENCIDTCDETTGITFDIDSGECIDICDESKGFTFSLEAYEDPDVTDPCVPLCDESAGETFDSESGECVDTCDASKGFQYDSDSGECTEICDSSKGLEYDVDSKECVDVCDSSLGQEWDTELQGCTSICNTDEGLTFDVSKGECVDICNADFGLIYDPLHVNASDEGCAPICDENDGVIFNPDASWADTKGCIPQCDDGYEPIPLENEDGYVRRLQTYRHQRTLKSNKRFKFIRGATTSTSVTRYNVHPQRKMKEHAYVVPRSLGHQRRTSESNRLCRAVCDGSKGEIYDVETGECVNKCTSEDEIYDETLEECIPNCDKTQGLAYDSVEGTCVCDESKHLTHHAASDSCICDEANGYTFDPFTTEDDNDHKCITICDSTKGQFYDSTLDTCQYQCDIKEGLAYNAETEECDPICADGEDTDCISSDVVCEEAMGLTFDSDLSECVYICNPLEGLEYDVTSQECTSVCDTEAGEIFNTVKQLCEPDCPNDGEYYLNDECINPCSDVSGDVHFDQVTNTCMCNNSEESIFYQSSDTTMAICGICDSSIGEELIDPSQLVGNDVVEFPDVIPKYPTCECYIIGASISQDTGKCSCKDQYYAVALEGNLDYYYGYNNGRPLCLIENYYNDAFEEFKFTPDYITA